MIIILLEIYGWLSDGSSICFFLCLSCCINICQTQFKVLKIVVNNCRTIGLFHFLFSFANILQAMHGWGKVLRTWYGKDPNVRYEDPTVKYLGYWTDNGK